MSLAYCTTTIIHNNPINPSIRNYGRFEILGIMGDLGIMGFLGNLGGVGIK